jgi:UDP-N-acetyl-D-galactosamine dehydrogenase
VDIIRELSDYGIRVRIHDPLADPGESAAYLGIQLEAMESLSDVDAVIVAVIHAAYEGMGIEKIAGLCANDTPLVVDVKGGFDPAEAERKKIRYWRL